ncbi:MAG: hypothetical protein DDT29_01058 [Dehalococcoidia bacterium]|nr:hypothetical protein [Bacillota bacterium]
MKKGFKLVSVLLTGTLLMLVLVMPASASGDVGVRDYTGNSAEPYGIAPIEVSGDVGMRDYTGNSAEAYGIVPVEISGDVGIQIAAVNARMSGPATMMLNSFGTWRGNVTYNAGIIKIPLPFRYDFTSEFWHPILPRIRVVGTNVPNLVRSVEGNTVFFRSGNMYSWSLQKEKWAVFSGQAVARGGMDNFTRGTLGMFWGDIARWITWVQ